MVLSGYAILLLKGGPTDLESKVSVLAGKARLSTTPKATGSLDTSHTLADSGEERTA